MIYFCGETFVENNSTIRLFSNILKWKSDGSRIISAKPLHDVAADSANGRGSGSGGEDGYQEPNVEYHDFDEETLLQIERNDRRIEGLSVSWDDKDIVKTFP